MSKPARGVPRKGSSREEELKWKENNSNQALCILTLDGGIPGTTETSQLIIIKQVLHDLQCRFEEDVDASDLIKLRPSDAFDYIVGSGMGGVFAILFVSLEYTVEQAIQFYCKLHERVFLSFHWKAKNKDKARGILTETLLHLLPQEILNSPLVGRNKNPKCRAVTFASNPHNVTHPRLFRTYISRQSTTPECSIFDALILSIVDSNHLGPHALGLPVEYFSGSGHRFSNPTSYALREVQSIVGDDHLLSCIVSVGAGNSGPLMGNQLSSIVRDCEREAAELKKRCPGTERLYFRLNVQQGLHSPIYGPSEVATHTNQYLEEIKNTLDSLGAQLHQRPGLLCISKTSQLFAPARNVTQLISATFVQDTSHSERKRMYEDVEFVRNTQHMRILEELEISKDASYISAATEKVQRRQCTVNTRVRILQEIEFWARNNQQPLSSSLFWIYGLAGTGKTTIMQTICEILDNAGLLASSYFCSIHLDSKESKRIVPTIARHLARHKSAFSQHLAAQLQAYPDYAHAQLAVQFRNLLQTPWGAACLAGTKESHCVVIIDALDECHQGEEVFRLILDAIDNGQLRGIRFLVTSRPVPTIVERARTMKHGTQMSLHEVSKEEVHGDVRRFLDEQLHGKIDSVQIGLLTSQADGLFIFASTLVKHVLPPEPLSRSERERRVERILAPTQQGKKVNLDELYKHILNGALSPEELLQDEFESRWRILQAVVCMAEPTSAQVLAKLLGGATVDDVMVALKSLHPVLYVATSEDPIYVIHASFQEFITSRTDPPFQCSLSAIHASMAKSCLLHMKERLKFNICGIKSSFTPDEELDPPIRAIGRLLAYACRHWWHHHRECNRDERKAMLTTIHHLIRDKGLFWIEAMSLLGDVRDCRDIFLELAAVSAGLHFFRRSNNIQVLATEAAKLISLFISISPKTTSQLYLSLVPFWEGDIFSCWKANFQRVPQVISRRIDGVRNCQMSINTAAPVTSVVFSSNNQIICGTSDSVVQIWETESGQQLDRLYQYGDSINCVASSPDGKWIASGSDNCGIKIWVANTGKELHHFHPSANSVWCVAFSPDNKRVVSGASDKKIRIWDIRSGVELAKLKGHVNWVLSVAYSPNCKYIVSGAADKTIRIWDSKSYIQLHQLNGHDDYVCSVVFSPDGNRIASGSQDKSVRIWDVKTGKQIRQLGGHGSAVGSVAFSPDSKRVVSGSHDKTVRIWDAKSGRELHQLNGHNDYIYSVGFSPDGKRVVSGSEDSTIRIWDTKPSTQHRQFKSHDNSVVSVAFSPDCKKIASGSYDRSARIWDTKTGRELLAFSPDGKHVVSCSIDKTIIICDVDSYWQLHQFKGHMDAVRSVAFSPDGQRIVSGSDDKTVIIWHVCSGKPLHQLNGHDEKVQSVAFSPDGQKVLSGSDDDTVRVWDARSGKQLRQFNHYHYVRSVVFSPDGRQVLSGSYDQTVRIWDADSGEQLRQFNHHSDVLTAAFSPDGKQIVSGSRDKIVRIWDSDSGRQIRQLNGHDGIVHSVAFSPQGKQILSCSADRTVRIWDVESRENLCQMDGAPDFFTSVIFLSRDVQAPNPNPTLWLEKAPIIARSLFEPSDYIYLHSKGWMGSHIIGVHRGRTQTLLATSCFETFSTPRSSRDFQKRFQ
ncbi:WD40-repeat-containing domain protein [Flagelloscypha sp. PMI_526]|nr:WD40-repeat-containing domain protein [Flagelloscypha sp. PMI_526]